MRTDCSTLLTIVMPSVASGEVSFLLKMPSQRLVLSIQHIISARLKEEWSPLISRRWFRSPDLLLGGVVDATV